jgi:hypothetical protein
LLMLLLLLLLLHNPRLEQGSPSIR